MAFNHTALAATMPTQKIIIDTDPGLDDIFALMYAFAAAPQFLLLLITVSYGNTGLHDCLRNVVSLFHYVEKELAWRAHEGRELGFEALRRSKPTVAVGPENPLPDAWLAELKKGSQNPHPTPLETWQAILDVARNSSAPEQRVLVEQLEKQEVDALFKRSATPAHEAILQALRDNDPGTVTIVALGPMTNLARAAAADPETFLRVKEVIAMGGIINLAGDVGYQAAPSAPPPDAYVPPFQLIKQPPGPIRNALNARNRLLPATEFNTFADPVATALIYALTSVRPRATVPPAYPGHKTTMTSNSSCASPYPDALSKPLNISLFPIDITGQHAVSRGAFDAFFAPHLAAGSPLATWTSAFSNVSFDKVARPGTPKENVTLQLHDPVPWWYAAEPADPGWKFKRGEDLRVETTGQWTRGLFMTDSGSGAMEEGNRINRCTESPAPETFGTFMLGKIFG